MSPSIRRSDISLTEEQDFDHYDAGTQLFTTTWTASLFGRLSTGEHVGMTRTGNTFAGALQNLEATIAELGWEVKG